MNRHIPVTDLPYANELVTCLPYAESELRECVAQAIGTASACWDNLEGAGVFDSDRATNLHKETMARILRLTGMGESALGCATTGELLEELSARADLNYRTVPARHAGLDRPATEENSR